MDTIFDIVIIGAGPSWLFCTYYLPQNLKVLLIEKNEVPAQKLLLSAKWRGNITNLFANKNHYYPKHQTFVENMLQQYSSSDFLSFLKEHDIAFHEENNGRILLDQKVKPFHQKLLDFTKSKGIIIENTEVKNITKEDNIFHIQSETKTFSAKNVIISTGSTSIPSLWSTNLAEHIANHFSLWFQKFYPALVGMNTQKDVSSLSGSSVIAQFELKYKNTTIYKEYGPLLFTHRWISGPSVFNASLYRDSQKDSHLFSCKLTIKKQEITKKLLAYLWFHSNKLPEYFFSTELTWKRGFDEAKVCWWGILTKELDCYCQTKKIPGLFFLGETIDVTGETWWFNLQRCRSSAFACCEYFNH